MKHIHPGASAPVPYCLNLLRSAQNGVYYNRLMYDYLLKNAPDEEAKNILTGIRNGEITHEKMRRQVYFHLAGKPFPQEKKGNFAMPSSYCEGLEKALKRKLESVSRNRNIALCLPNINQAIRINDISSEEMQHALLYQYLIRKNQCNF